MRTTGRTAIMRLGPRLSVVLATVLALVVASPSGSRAQDNEDRLRVLDVLMQLAAQGISHLAEAGFVPQLYTVEGSLGLPTTTTTTSSPSSSGPAVTLSSINGSPSAAFTAGLSGPSQFVTGSTSTGTFSGTGFNRTLMDNGKTWVDVDTTFSGPALFSSTIEDLKLVSFLLRPMSRLEVAGAQIETSAAGVLRRKMALSYAYSLTRQGVLGGRGTGKSFVPGDAVDRQLVFDVAGDVDGGGGNFAGIAGVLRAEERLLLVDLKADGPPAGDVTLDPPDKEGRNRCALPGDSDPKKQRCGFIYDENQQVTATATAGAGAKFVKWDDLCKGTKGPTCTFTVIGNFDKITAKFK